MTGAARLLLGLAVLAPGVARAGDALARGDAAWARRAEGAVEAGAAFVPIGEALDHYRAAVEADPSDLTAHWKRVRALHFAGEFTADPPEPRQRYFERGRRAAEDGLDRLAARLGAGERADALESEALRSRLAAAGIAPEPVARLHFWAAIAWGAWSRDAGLLSLVREGVANRLHRYAQVTLDLEPAYEGGGALRLLGRLHAELPRVPFLSGWVDRERAIPELERALEIAPRHPGNRLLLGITLLERASHRRDEALALLRDVAELEPRPGSEVEDRALRADARRRLEEVDADGEARWEPGRADVAQRDAPSEYLGQRRRGASAPLEQSEPTRPRRPPSRTPIARERERPEPGPVEIGPRPPPGVPA